VDIQFPESEEDLVETDDDGIKVVALNYQSLLNHPGMIAGQSV